MSDLQVSKPYLVIRLGFTETKVLAASIQGKRYRTYLRYSAAVFAGIKSPSKRVLDGFAREYINAINEADAIGTWGSQALPEETDVLRNVDAKQFPAAYLDPVSNHQFFFGSVSWLEYLRNKKVLVIHPFSLSISHQHQRLSEMHRTLRIPNFDLVTFTPPVTQGISTQSGTYLTHLSNAKQRLRDCIEKNKPDIALISAGAYGAPLAKFCHDSGISAIHMGGSLQLLFGIMGNRWRASEAVSDQVTTNWLLSPLEKPPRGKFLVEGGTYW
jgi:hypothetical protein